jgi:hypothetical protein
MREDVAKVLNDGNALNVIDLEAERSVRARRKRQDEHPAGTPTIAALKGYLATLQANIAKVGASRATARRAGGSPQAYRRHGCRADVPRKAHDRNGRAC